MKHITWMLLAIVALWGCDNSLDITAPYEDTTVVFGLIDPTDSVNYVRVGKAFLGEGNALEYAQELDSLTYGDQIEVVMVEGSTGLRIPLERMEDSNKPEGLFHAPGQVYYRTNHSFNEDSWYRLEVTKGDTAAIVSATTPIINNFAIDNPRVTSTVAMVNPNFPYSIKWRSAVDARVFEVSISVDYLEVSRTNPADSVLKSITWDLGSEVARDTDGDQDLKIDLPFPSFFNFMRANVAVDDQVHRHFRGMSFLFAAAGENFYTYRQVNGSGGFFQEPPLFTNVENGVGLLDSRYNKVVPNLDITDPMYDSLACGSITRELGFAKYDFDFANNQIDTIYCY